ncbi:hypothetical protein NQ317_019951 [Molorchus minor]|uniref:DNA recombination and repair protein Rad51-like C-terminal domain-containing protein n=1 Tax=Molorchus minor TaxID=1323400 RepID=A0ABQ9IU75_9CUCU|nr:hypothetical protein NQ317_019951 [Molorchus minor]
MENKIESGVQLFSRVTRKTCLEGINPHLLPEGKPCPNQIIEIIGDDSQVDKTNLLIDFIVRCILPVDCNREWKGSTAILVNTEFQINLFKIIKVIENLLQKNQISKPKKHIIKSALKNLIIFNCFNLEELEVTFHKIEKTIHHNENVSLVLIDNIATQFWISKFTDNRLSYYQHSLRIFGLIHDIIKSLQVVLIFARNENANNKRFSKEVDFRIEIVNGRNDFNAVVTNYENQSKICVPIKLEPFLEFINVSNS